MGARNELMKASFVIGSILTRDLVILNAMTIDSDSAEEQENVLKTLSEREISTSELVQSVLSQVQTEFATWNVAHCREALTSLTASSTWRSCLHPGLRLPVMAAFNSSPDTRPDVSVANSPSLLLCQQVYSPDGGVETSSVALEVVHIISSLETHPPYESSSPLHRSVFKGDDSDSMDFIPYADDHTFDQTSHTYHYESFSWQDAFDPDCERRTHLMIVRQDNI